MHNLRKIDGSFTKVGVQQGEIHEDDAGFSDLVTIAAANEFGTKNIPSRPFMRNSVDKNKPKIKKLQENALSKIFRGTASVRQSLRIIGEGMEGFIKKEIKDLKFPANKPSTIKRKGSSNPLIDTEQMRQNITHIEVLR